MTTLFLLASIAQPAPCEVPVSRVQNGRIVTDVVQVPVSQAQVTEYAGPIRYPVDLRLPDGRWLVIASPTEMQSVVFEWNVTVQGRRVPVQSPTPRTVYYQPMPVRPGFTLNAGVWLNCPPGGT